MPHGGDTTSAVPQAVLQYADRAPAHVHAFDVTEEMMEETGYGLRVEVPLTHEQAVEGATDALKAQGFGVLTTIDVKQTLKQKLDREFRKYVILGACHPRLADRALHTELEIGLLLPCNVIVYELSPGRSASRRWRR